MKEKTLEERMMLALAGDQRVYGELLGDISRIVRSYLLKKLSSPSDVEDVVQEVLCSIHKARHTYDGKRPLKPWVFAIATYRLNDHLRKVYRDLSRQSVDYDSLANSLAEDVTSEDGRDELLTIVDKLPERQKNIVTLMKIEGYTAKEVAKQLDMSESAVKVAAHRAYKKLKILMENAIQEAKNA